MSLADQSFTLTYFVGVCVGGGGEVFAHTFATVDKDARGQLAWVLCAPPPPFPPISKLLLS